MNPHTDYPRIWWQAARETELRTALAENEPTAVFLLEQTRLQLAEVDYEKGFMGIEPRVMLAWLEGDAAEADTQMRQWCETARTKPNSNLGEAGAALTGAVLLDVSWSQLTPETRREVAAVLWELVAKLRVPTRGNPHIVVNNWWAVTHGAALCAALSARRVEDAPGADVDAVPWALGRLRAFCEHFGPSGLYHEGLGYIRYTAMFVLSAVLAAQAAGEADLLALYPNLRHMLPSLYAATVPRQVLDDNVISEPRYGATLSWNDMGQGVGASCVDHIGLAIAPPELQADLKAWHDLLMGRKSRTPSIGGHHANVPLAWAVHPLGLPEGDPARLPCRVQDSRQGFFFWRDGYKSEADVVLGVYAKATFPGGHKHEDAGSLRLDAFGSDWIAGPGQARGQRVGQSVAYPEEPPKENLGYFNFLESSESGFRLSMELRKSSGAYHERLLALDRHPGGDAAMALALLDVMDDHKTRDWHWGWTFGKELEASLHADQLGCTFAAPTGWFLHLRFLAARPETLFLEELPESTRTFSGGNVEIYRGKPVLRARFAPQPHLAVFVAGVWSREPVMDLRGDVHEIHFQGGAWTRPFGAALPNGFVAGTSLGPSQHSRP